MRYDDICVPGNSVEDREAFLYQVLSALAHMRTAYLPSMLEFVVCPCSHRIEYCRHMTHAQIHQISKRARRMSSLQAQHTSSNKAVLRSCC